MNKLFFRKIFDIIILMKVLILGFKTKEEIDAEMEKLIAGSGCYLFYVVCGSAAGASYEWAVWRGAPVVFEEPGSPQDLIKMADYLVIKLEEKTPAWMKNLVMQWKAAGKHGTVVRG